MAAKPGPTCFRAEEPLLCLSAFDYHTMPISPELALAATLGNAGAVLNESYVYLVRSA